MQGYGDMNKRQKHNDWAIEISRTCSQTVKYEDEDAYPLSGQILIEGRFKDRPIGGDDIWPIYEQGSGYER